MTEPRAAAAASGWPSRLWWTGFTLREIAATRHVPWLSRERLEALQSRRVRAMAAHAYATVPFYRDAMQARGLTPRDFASAADLAKRVALRRAELDALASLGALASLEAPAPTRRAALWQVAAIERDAASLFAGAAPEASASPLDDMTPLEETLADYRDSGLTTGPQVLAHLRAELAARGVVTTEALRRIPNGRSARLAGHVIVRQRPVAAKGFCFLTLEDETGTANAVLAPDAFRRFRATLQTAPLVEIEGPLQNLEGVVHLRVRSLAPLRLHGALPPSHDYR